MHELLCQGTVWRPQTARTRPVVHQRVVFCTPPKPAGGAGPALPLVSPPQSNFLFRCYRPPFPHKPNVPVGVILSN